MIFNSKGGFTLIELMVYIALLGGIVLIAGQAFSDSTKMRVRTQSMLQANQAAGNVGTILKEDIAQLGAKSSKEAGAVNFDVSHINKFYIDSTADSSSFLIDKDDGGDGLDKITMRRLRYSNTGKYEAIEEVSWFVEDHVLKRSCISIDAQTENEECPSTDTSTVTIADNVNKFKITPAKPSTTVSTVSKLPSTSEANSNFKLVSRFGDDNFERINVTPENGTDYESGVYSITLSGFSINYDFENNEPYSNPDLIKANQVFLANIGSSSNSWSSQCIRINLDPYIEYEISFAMPITADDPSRMFCPGRDHMAVGFRYAETGNRPTQLNDFQFYPPTIGDATDTGLRKMRFSTNDTIKGVCLGFTFVSFSPVASSGNINIKDVKLKIIPSSNYTFSNEEIATADKKNVKAIKLEFSVNKNGEAGAETLIIPIPSNGPRD